MLYEEAIRRGECALAATGPLVCRTGHHTGRSPNDTYFVREASSERLIHWGAVNCAIDEASFDALNETLPLRGVMPMHCSANVGKGGDSALFFGLSGTSAVKASGPMIRPIVAGRGVHEDVGDD